MRIEINVDELQFKEILDSELKNLPQEKIHEVILEGIRTYFTNNPNVIKDLFVEQSSWSYRGSPSSYLKSILSREIPVGAFADLIEGMLKNLKDNYDKVLKDAIIELMMQGMFNSYGFQDRFRETLRDISNN